MPSQVPSGGSSSPDPNSFTRTALLSLCLHYIYALPLETDTGEQISPTTDGRAGTMSGLVA